MRIPLAGWVAPFGDPGITDRSHLPRAFRSVPRPSSPLSAKASTRCPFLRLIPGGTPKVSTHCVPPHKTAAHRGKTLLPASAGCSPRESGGPCHKAASHEDTSPDTHAQLSRLRPACPPRSHDKLSLYPSINPPPGCPDGVACASPNVARHRPIAPPAHHAGAGGAQWWRCQWWR
jgi:hypothetical protein